MIRRPPGSTLTDTLFPSTTLCRSNGLSRDLELKPGQAIRVDDVIVRLRACETTAPHEIQQLTGAFVQVDVRNLEGRFERIFSGWLYKESPSLNVVRSEEHTSELQSLMRISYAVFCLTKKNKR